MNTEPEQLGIARSLFLGHIAEDLLFPYPEMPDDERETVSQVIDAFKTFAEREIDPVAIDRDGELPETVRTGLAEMGLLGLVVPEKYDGFGFGTTAYCRVMEEVARSDSSTAVFVGGHESIGIKALLLHGTEDQKKRFLPKLATGELIAAYALTEPGAGSDAAAVASRAERIDGSTSFLLNGQKQFVTNGGYAGLVTVFAKTPVRTRKGLEDKITAFIVTSDMPGVSVGKTEKKFGIKGSSTTELIFENVEIPEENILGELGRGFRVAMEVLNTGRLSLAAGAVGGGKELLRLSTEYASQRKQFGKPIIEFEMIRDKLATMASDLYAMESMVYLTTGLVDRSVQDFSIESAMCKLFSSEALWQMTDTALQIAGGYGYMTEYPYERHMRDARINRIFEGTNEIQKLFIALSGLKEPGQKLREVGKALSNPIESVGTIGSYAAERLKRVVTHEHLTKASPALKEYASHLESLTADLAARSDELLRKHKKAIIQREYIQDRLAEAATNLFAMAATLSRTSTRLDAVGETDAEKDVMLCRVFCERAWRAARRRRREGGGGDFSDIDTAARMIQEAGGYPF